VGFSRDGLSIAARDWKSTVTRSRAAKFPFLKKNFTKNLQLQISPFTIMRLSNGGIAVSAEHSGGPKFNSQSAPCENPI
jgi:hypothetical protein